MSNQDNLRLAYFSAITNAVIIGFSFLFTKLSLHYAHPLDTLMYRFAVSFLAIFMLVTWQKYQLGGHRQYPMMKLRFRKKQIYPIVLLAILYPVGFFALQTFGLEKATSAEGGILFAFIPVITFLLAKVFLKEKTSFLQMLCIFISVFGVIFIFVSQGFRIELTNLTGILLLLFSCLSMAGYNVLARSLLKQYRPIEISYLLTIVGFIVFLSISIIRHAAQGTLHQLIHPLMHEEFLLSILYLGVLSSLITSLLTNYALAKLEASRMSVFSQLSTIVSILAGGLFLEEQITFYHLIGSFLIIGGVLGTNLFGKKLS